MPKLTGFEVLVFAQSFIALWRLTYGDLLVLAADHDIYDEHGRITLTGPVSPCKGFRHQVIFHEIRDEKDYWRVEFLEQTEQQLRATASEKIQAIVKDFLPEPKL